MRKKICFMVSFLCFSLFASSCASTKAATPNINEFLAKESISLTCDMDTMSESTEYLSFMSVSEAINKTAEKIASNDYTAPENIYFIQIPTTVILESFNASVQQQTLSEDIKELLSQKINSAVFANIINASYGVDTLATTSILTKEKSYIQPENWSDNTLVLLEYKGEFSSIVSFSKSGDGVISALAIFVKNGENTILNSIKSLFDTTDISISYTTLSGSELQNILLK